jgi:ketosteroid isomerase-like protein
MSGSENAELMIDIFKAIERRDLRRLAELFHPQAQFIWDPSLPYGGARGDSGAAPPTWEEVWMPLQPTESERAMNARVVAASGDEVVVLWRQRGVRPDSKRFDGEVLGLYEIRGGRLVRAQMFNFDTVALADFLAKTDRPVGRA